MEHRHRPANDASRRRLGQLVDRLPDEALGHWVDADWTVGALLAHLSFWDRFVLARWDHAIESGLAAPIDLDERITDLINGASIDAWRRMPGRLAAELVLAAASSVDERIAGLPVAMVEATLASGRPRLVDRSRHRVEHLDAIERALADS